jgi:hypothetical protein
VHSNPGAAGLFRCDLEKYTNKQIFLETQYKQLTITGAGEYL